MKSTAMSVTKALELCRLRMKEDGVAAVTAYEEFKSLTAIGSSIEAYKTLKLYDIELRLARK